MKASIRSLLSVICVAALTIAVAAPARAASAGDWSKVSSPNGGGSTSNVLSDVTCPSPSLCWAVGSTFTSGFHQTLIERWDGTSWSVVFSGNANLQDNILSSVTCASATSCWAVGLYYVGATAQTLILRWDGTNPWAVFTSPNTNASAFNALTGVTCASVSDCWAVGHASNGAVPQALTERWNGTAWSIVSSPSTGPADTNILSDVSCVTPSDCWASGSHGDDNTGIQTLIEHWNGTVWAIVTSPNSRATDDNVLSSVTCASASDCWAVGFYTSGATGGRQTLIEHWNGTVWIIVISPNTSSTQDDLLSGVTCASATDCWAVGYSSTGVPGGTYGDVRQTLVERWNGTVWSIVSAPNPAAPEDNVLSGVTCVAVSDCWTVGSTSNIQQTLIERWNGTSWAVVSSPNVSSTQPSAMSSVTCVSASDCWAVGNYLGSEGYQQTLIEHWDGTSWQVVASPNTAPVQGNFLQSVTCTAASDCWAVGYYSNGAANQTLILHWNGIAWLIDSSPSTGGALYGVTCVSLTDCWAVGYSGGFSALTIHWDGATWSMVESPDLGGSGLRILFGVDCVTTSDCWAAGRFDNPSKTLLQHWDGTAWSLVSSPNAVTLQANTLSGVTCKSTTACFAVGNYKPGTGTVTQTLIERWDGTTWSIVPSPNTQVTEANLLAGVTCTSTTTCIAVGNYKPGTGTVTQTLIERWDGTAWSVVPSPNTQVTEANRLNAVTCGPSSNCWAVGNAASSTLILRTNLSSTVNQATLTLSGASAGQYSDPASVSALLKFDGVPAANRLVTFDLGSSSASATTNASGVASVPFTLLQSPGNYPLKASWAGFETTIPPAAATRTFTIELEDSAVDLSLANNGADAVLTATLKDADTAANCVASAPITFKQGASVLGTSNTNTNGVGAFTVPNADPNAGSFTAEFAGNTFYLPSISTGAIYDPQTITLVSVTDPIRDTNLDNVSASGQTQPGSTVKVVFSDGLHNLSKAAAVTSGGAWSMSALNASGLANGPIDVTATATGTRGTATATRTVQKLSSVLAPSVAMTGDGFGYVGANNNPEAIEIKVTNNAPQASNDVHVVATDALGAVTDLGTYTMLHGETKNLMLNATALADGVITATASIGDKTGSAGVTLDRGKPTATIADPGTKISLPFGSVSFSGTAADTLSPVESVRVTLKSGNNIIQTLTATRSAIGSRNTNWNVSFNQFLTPGTSYSIVVKSIDAANNPSDNVTSTFTVL